MKKSFTHLIAELIDAKKCLLGVFLLLVLLLVSQLANAQTITSISPPCATVGEGTTLTISGMNFTTGTTKQGNSTEGNVKVIITNSTGDKSVSTIVEAYSANEIRNIGVTGAFLSQAGTYTVQVANRDNTGSGFLSPSSAFSFPVYAKLTIGQPSGLSSVCVNSTSSYSINVAGAKTYEWTVSGGATIASGGDTGSPIIHFDNTTGTVRIGVRAFNQCDFPTAFKYIDVTVNPLPEVKITNPAAVCSPGTVDLTASSIVSGSTSGLTYTYWTDAAATTQLQNPGAVSASGTYYIKGTKGTSAEGCSDIEPVQVTINPLPEVKITNPAAVCSPGTVDLTASSIVS
ncbi:IPT/TIG domain-containing protein, partial [Pontibacter ummariensis]